MRSENDDHSVHSDDARPYGWPYSDKAATPVAGDIVACTAQRAHKHSRVNVSDRGRDREQARGAEASFRMARAGGDLSSRKTSPPAGGSARRVKRLGPMSARFCVFYCDVFTEEIM